MTTQCRPESCRGRRGCVPTREPPAHVYLTRLRYYWNAQESRNDERARPLCPLNEDYHMELATVFLLALLLLCPISMYWMMRRHRGKGADEGQDAQGAPPEDPREKPRVDPGMFRK